MFCNVIPVPVPGVPPTCTGDPPSDVAIWNVLPVLLITQYGVPTATPPPESPVTSVKLTTLPSKK